MSTAATDQGVEITGPPFAMYFGIPSHVLNVPAGFPTAGPVIDTDGVTATQTPGGRAAASSTGGPE